MYYTRIKVIWRKFHYTYVCQFKIKNSYSFLLPWINMYSPLSNTTNEFSCLEDAKRHIDIFLISTSVSDFFPIPIKEISFINYP